MGREGDEEEDEDFQMERDIEIVDNTHLQNIDEDDLYEDAD